jgi:hypothetical protein
MDPEHLMTVALVDKESTASLNSDLITTKDSPKKIKQSADPTEESFVVDASNPASSALFSSKKSKQSKELNKHQRNERMILPYLNHLINQQHLRFFFSGSNLVVLCARIETIEALTGLTRFLKVPLVIYFL